MLQTNTPPKVDYVGDRFMRMREVVNTVGASKSAIYNWMRAKQFPKPVKIGMQRVAWKASDIRQWMAQRETTI